MPGETGNMPSGGFGERPNGASNRRGSSENSGGEKSSRSSQ